MAMTSDYDLDMKLAEFKIKGYVVFEDFVAVPTIDRMRETFIPLLDELREKTRHMDPSGTRDDRRAPVAGGAGLQIPTHGHLMA